MSGSPAVGRQMVWNLLGNATSFFSSFVTQIIIARMLGPAEMGKFAVAIALMALLQSALFLGTTNFIVREREMARDLLGSVLSLALVQGLVVGGLILAVSRSVAIFQSVDEVEQILHILALVPMLAPLEGIALAYCIRSTRFDLTMVITGAKAITQCAVSLALAFTGHGVFSLAWGLVAGGAVAATLGALILSGQIGIELNRRHWRRMLGFSVQALTVTWLNTANQRLPEFVLGRWAGLTNVGLFSRAAATSDLLRRFVLSPVAQVLFPRLSRAYHAGDDITHATLDFNARLVMFFWPIHALLAALSTPVIALLYGAEWHGAAPVLALLAIASALNISSSGGTEALVIIDRQSWTMRIELSRTVLGVILIVLATPYGIAAVALMRCLDGLLGAILYVFSMARLNLIDARQWMILQARALALAAATAAPVLLLPIGRIAGHVPLFEIAIGGALGLAGFALGALLLRDPYIHEGYRALGRALAPVKARFG